MPTRNHLIETARRLKITLGNQGFTTMTRADITHTLREVSTEPKTRMKSVLAADLERALLERGVRCYPSLVGTEAKDSVRLFHTETVVARLIDALNNPDPRSDRELGEAIRKIKGNWQWPSSDGVTAIDSKVA
jgi:hypothetical protein